MMDTIIDIPMLLTFLIIGVTVTLYALEKFSIELTSLGAVVAFVVLFSIFPSEYDGRMLEPKDILAGFANPALITVIALLITGQGLFQTDALEGPVQLLLRYTKNRKLLAVVTILISACCISAVTNNTPVVVMILPILISIALTHGSSPSMLLMPLSFVSILGGMTTLIGSSTNLLVADLVLRTSGDVVGFFTITPIGVLMAAIGLVYIIFIMPLILKPNNKDADDTQVQSGKQFIAQITVDRFNPLVGMKSVAGMFPKLKNMSLRVVQRGNKQFLPPLDDLEIQPGDSINVSATRDELKKALSQTQSIITPGNESGDASGHDSPATDISLAEAVIAPGSRYKDRMAKDINLRSRTGCTILGIQRRSQMPRSSMSDIVLEAGDVLLISGARSDIDKLRSNHDLLLLDWSDELPQKQYAARARLIFFTMIAVAASGILPIVTASLLGCFAMVAARCLNIRQAIRSIDSRIYMLIGTSLAAGLALEATNGSIAISELLKTVLEGQSPTIMLMVLFFIIAALTNVLSNNATAVILTPIVIEFALQTQLPMEACIVCLIIAANCAFVTPIGYQTNLIVLSPGNYRFLDFVKAGLPLALLLWISFSIITPLYYGL